MATTVRIADDSEAHVFTIEEPTQDDGGEYSVRVTVDDDTEGHVLSAAWAVDGYLKVAARDGRAMRVDVHDTPRGRWFRARRASDDDVAGHALEEHEWQGEIEGDDDVAGHVAKRDDKTLLSAASATALAAMLYSTGDPVQHAVRLAR